MEGTNRGRRRNSVSLDSPLGSQFQPHTDATAPLALFVRAVNEVFRVLRGTCDVIKIRPDVKDMK